MSAFRYEQSELKELTARNRERYPLEFLPAKRKAARKKIEERNMLKEMGLPLDSI